MGNRGYHHGDLRNALILAAAEIIEESGSLSFSMADAARRAGVSSAAPYRHFRDREALLEAVAQLAFHGLGEVSRAAVAATEPGSRAAIHALGRNYLDYVTEKAAFYDLMWGDAGARTSDPDTFDRNASGFYHLTLAVQAYLDREWLTRVNTRETAIQLWALVHGLSAVAMSGKLAHFHPDADLHRLLAEATDRFLSGLAVERHNA